MAAAMAAEFVQALRHGMLFNSDLALTLIALAVLAAAWLVGWRSWARAGHAAEEARRGEARQRTIIDSAGEAIIVIDDQASIFSFNRAAERMFGYAAAEMIGTSLERLMTDGARHAHAAYLAQTGVTAMIEAARLRTLHKGLRKRGDVFPFEMAMTEWSDQGRRMFTLVVRDVTEHELAAAALRESQIRFAELYDNNPEPLFIYVLAGDGGFVLESMNRAAEHYTGLSRFAVAGAPPEELATDEDARDFKRSLLHCLSSAARVIHDVRLRSKGERLHLRFTLSPMREDSGEIRRVLVSGRDLAQPVAPAAPADSRTWSPDAVS